MASIESLLLAHHHSVQNSSMEPSPQTWVRKISKETLQTEVEGDGKGGGEKVVNTKAKEKASKNAIQSICLCLTAKYVCGKIYM